MDPFTGEEDWVLDFEDTALNLQQADPWTPHNGIDSKALARIPCCVLQCCPSCRNRNPFEVELTVISFSGGRRARFLGLVKSGALTHEQMDSEGFRIRSYGDTAIATALTRTR
jgi:hypothetical protein